MRLFTPRSTPRKKKGLLPEQVQALRTIVLLGCAIFLTQLYQSAPLSEGQIPRQLFSTRHCEQTQLARAALAGRSWSQGSLARAQRDCRLMNQYGSDTTWVRFLSDSQWSKQKIQSLFSYNK